MSETAAEEKNEEFNMMPMLKDLNIDIDSISNEVFV